MKEYEIKTGAALSINWRWSNPPPFHLTGFRNAFIRAWMERFGPNCLFCDRPMVIQKGGKHKRRATIDHINCRGMGGTDDLSNIQVICTNCNSSKSREESDAIKRDGHWWRSKRRLTFKEYQHG